MATTHPAARPPMAAVSRILAQYDREKVEAFVEVAIGLLDTLDGDSDVELNGDEEDSDGDEKGDQAWIEWHTMRAADRRGPNRTGTNLHGAPLQEDDEADGDEQDGDWAEDEFPARGTSFQPSASAPGCPVADPDYCLAGDDRVTSGAIGGPGVYLPSDGPGDADDAEDWRQTSNVPMPAVVSADHNLFTDERVSLGIANLQSSFRTNGREVRSADSGKMLRTTALDDERKPGSPV